MTDHELGQLVVEQRRWLVVQIIAGVAGIAAIVVGCFVTMWALPFGPLGYLASEYAHDRVRRITDSARLFFAYDHEGEE